MQSVKVISNTSNILTKPVGGTRNVKFIGKVKLNLKQFGTENPKVKYWTSFNETTWEWIKLTHGTCLTCCFALCLLGFLSSQSSIIHFSFDTVMILVGEKRVKIFFLFTIVAALSWCVIQQLSSPRGLKNRKVHITSNL